MECGPEEDFGCRGKRRGIMKKIKMFPAPHVELRIHVSDEMVRDLEKCERMVEEKKAVPCTAQKCSWDEVDVFGQCLCGIPEIQERVLEEVR